MIPMLLFLVQVVSNGAGTPYPPDVECQAEDTIGMIACQKHDLAIWDRRLNVEYNRALNRVGPASRKRIRDAQRIWLRYRTKNCEIYEGHGGSIHFILGGGCMIEMTKDRTLELRGFDSGFNQDNELTYVHFWVGGRRSD